MFSEIAAVHMLSRETSSRDGKKKKRRVNTSSQDEEKEKMTCKYFIPRWRKEKKDV